MNLNMYYVVNARMPTEKAHGIQIAKMCEAFIESGLLVTLVVPNRSTVPESIKNFYNLRVEVPCVRLPAPDWYTKGPIGYFLSSVCFSLSYFIFLTVKKMRKNNFILYTVDIDRFSSSLLSFINRPFFSEMHGSKPPVLSQKILFKYAHGIIAINDIIVRELKMTFSNSRTRYIVEPNGVDSESFSAHTTKKDARIRLGLPLDCFIVLYAGRFFMWKGLEIISRAAKLSNSVRWQMVGGTKSDFERLTKEQSEGNIFFAGDRPHTEMPFWFAAADALLVLGTSRDVQSYRYTSPMKLFEYMTAGRPIICSRTPAIQQIVDDTEVIFYEPDNAVDLVRAAHYAVSGDKAVLSLIEAIKKHSAKCSWHARAERIVAFVRDNSNIQ